MGEVTIKTRRDLLDPEKQRIFDGLEVNRCGTINTDNLSVEVCRLDEEHAEIRVKQKLL
jgi:hypothetical protein